MPPWQTDQDLAGGGCRTMQVNGIITTVHENAGRVATALAPHTLRSMVTKAEGTARPGHAGFLPEKGGGTGSARTLI